MKRKSIKWTWKRLRNRLKCLKKVSWKWSEKLKLPVRWSHGVSKEGMDSVNNDIKQVETTPTGLCWFRRKNMLFSNKGTFFVPRRFSRKGDLKLGSVHPSDYLVSAIIVHEVLWLLSYCTHIFSRPKSPKSSTVTFVWPLWPWNLGQGPLSVR